MVYLVLLLSTAISAALWLLRVRKKIPEKSELEQRPKSRLDLHEIYHIAFLLRQKLVADVVPLILEHAGIFQSHVYAIHLDPPDAVTEYGAPLTVCTTPEIRPSARLQYPVRKVVFTIQSCDQGWADDMDAGSWTWFTARILRGKESPASSAKVATADDSNVGSSADDEYDRDDEVLEFERELYRNQIAVGEFQTYVIEWSVDSPDEEERKWVRGLRNGDRIEVRAWARFGVWTNRVQSVEVAVYTAALV